MSVELHNKEFGTIQPNFRQSEQYRTVPPSIKIHLGYARVCEEQQRQGRCRSDGGGVSLPEDIIFFDVLARLPVKPLCRFKCVSKRWRALISDPAFVAAQKSRGPRLVMAAFQAPLKPAINERETVELELRVMDTDGTVLRVVEGVKSAAAVPNLVHTRLNLVCVDNRRLGASVIDPVNGRVVMVSRIWPEQVTTRISRLHSSTPAWAVPLRPAHTRSSASAPPIRPCCRPRSA